MDKDLYAKTVAQLEQETERYLRDYTLCEPDLDRYGFGKHIMRMLLSGLAMHALGHFMPQPGDGSSAPDKPTTPGFQEQEHPREAINAGQKQAGQFAPKHGHADAGQAGQSGADHPVKTPQMPHVAPPAQPAPRPLDSHTAAVAEKWHGSQSQQHADFRSKVLSSVDHFDKTGQQLPKPESPKPAPYKAPTDTAYNAYKPTPEQKAEAVARQKQKDAGEFSRNYPDNLNKPPAEQANYAPPERQTPEASKPWWHSDNQEPVTLNPGIPGVTESAKAPTQDRHVEPTQEEIAALDNDPYNYDPEATAPTAAPVQQQEPQSAKPAQPATLKPAPQDDEARAQQQAEARAKRNAEHAAKLAEQKAAKPTASEQKNAAKRIEFDPTGWGDDDEASTTSKKGLEQVAARHGLETDQLGKHIDEMEKHDQEQWRQKRQLQSDVRKYIGSNTARRQSANDGKKGHEEYHDIADALSGNIPHEVLVAHFGHDPQDWDHQAYELANSPTLERPGRHDPEWVEKHAKDLANRMESASQAPEYDYPEPEDGVPFSRKSLAAEIDRYFYKAVQEYRRRNKSAVSRIWTDISRYP